MPAIGLKPEEIAAAFATDDLRMRFPPVLNVAQAAELLGRPTDTIRLWISQGRFRGAVRKRGKGYLIWRDRFLNAAFNGPDWHDG